MFLLCFIAGKQNVLHFQLSLIIKYELKYTKLLWNKMYIYVSEGKEGLCQIISLTKFDLD